MKRCAGQWETNTFVVCSEQELVISRAELSWWQKRRWCVVSIEEFAASGQWAAGDVRWRLCTQYASAVGLAACCRHQTVCDVLTSLPLLHLCCLAYDAEYSASANLNEPLNAELRQLALSFLATFSSRHPPKHRPSFGVTVHEVHLYMSLLCSPFYSDLLPYAMHRGSCLEMYYCNMVEWSWWDSSLIWMTS